MKIMQVKSPKKSFLDQLSNFGWILAQNYASFNLRIQSKDSDWHMQHEKAL